MSEQLYQLRSKIISGTEIDKETEINERIQKDKMFELLKRNHDVMMEKYELFRQRNELLEKKIHEKETLYVQIKAENDDI